ncbi:hypothetical protein UlMin_019450 [Ulmus minor]
MENRYGLFRQASGVWRSLRDGDFEEADVWAVLKDRTDSNTKVSISKGSSMSLPRNIPNAAKMIPRDHTRRSCASSSGSGVEFNQEGKIVQQSAPVNVPNWANMYRHKSKKSSKNASWHDDGNDDEDEDEDDGVVNHGRDSDDEDDDDDDDEYDCKVPPHELIARRLSKSQISSFSVFEGVGRTLKGRDLSKVRNAVLTKTGFLE